MSGLDAASRSALRRLVPRLLLLLACLAAWVPSVVADDDDPVLARAFEVRYRELADAADVVGPLLSVEGSVTLKPRLRVLVIQDHVSVLERVDALLESFDLPPRNVEVTLSLFLGTDREAEEKGRTATDPRSMSTEVRGVIEALGDFTRWTAYEPLGSRSVSGAEGTQVVANLSEDYRVVFTIDAVHPGQRVVTFHAVSLQRVGLDDEGRRRVDDLYTAEMALNLDRLHVVGAASGPDSKRALFLTLQVSAR